MRDTANRQEHSTLDRRPDGSIFFESDEPAFKLSEDELEKAEASQANRRRANFAARKPFIARTSHSLSLTPVEIKYTPGSSGFKVNKDGELELPSNAESVRTRGQLFEYCMHMFGRQPRQHLLAVHIHRNMVTLIGMDRVALGRLDSFSLSLASSSLLGSINYSTFDPQSFTIPILCLIYLEI